MYTKQALRELGVTPATLTDAQQRQLDEEGFFTVENVLSEADLELMRAEFERMHNEEREQGGHEVHVEPGARRVSNIFNKTAEFDQCLEVPEILAAAAYLLGEIKVHGANLRDPVQGYGQQDLHVDVPKRFADDWWVVNAMVMLDPMTLENGPTRVVPGSHKWAPINVPYVNQGDWEPAPLSEEDQARVPADLGAPYPGEVLVTAPAGSAIICNSSMWHSGTRKVADTPRRMLHLTYTRRDLPQQLVQLDHLTREFYDRMSQVHRWLLEIEPPREDEGVLRHPKRESRGWWN
ncbi:MAG: phytanoyl-CoA dioxygenase family protein [Geminicoccaceae bacterium]